ncbi:MAG: patatin-like phospholipase family protein, partial [Comamonadaceae bacterium]
MPAPIPLNLALQGGGAHGAFTWGVLDRLLEEPGISFARVSGTSAGALNGAALVSGLLNGGSEGARRALSSLWESVAAEGLPFTLLMLPLHKPSLGLWDDAMPLVSPQMANPFGHAPLRSVLNAVVDFEALRSARRPSLYVNAVSVNTGFGRVFAPGELTVETLLSACAPFLFPPVQIGSECYWDGSYATNPSLWPLYQGHDDADILMVELT